MAKEIPTKLFADDNEYRVWGLPFNNENMRNEEFRKAIAKLL